MGDKSSNFIGIKYTGNGDAIYIVNAGNYAQQISIAVQQKQEVQFI